MIRKYTMSPSTWIILCLSFIISGLVAGYMPFKLIANAQNNNYYGRNIILSSKVMSSTLAVFSSIFAGFKASSMFRDEIESGTFLVTLSKPISRRRIIFQKWFALQTAMLIFALLNVLLYVIVVAVIDDGEVRDIGALGVLPLKSNLFKVGAFIFLILWTVGLIFSSISMLLSTKISSASTIGIAITIGVVIPITGMVGLFTHQNNIETKAMTYAFDDLKKRISGMEPLVSSKNKEEVIHVKSMVDDALKFASNPKTGVYKIGTRNDKNDQFNYFVGFDINYQINTLGEFATDNIVSKEYIASMGSDLKISKQMTPIVHTIQDPDDPLKNLKTSLEKNELIFSHLIDTSIKIVHIGKVMEKIMLDEGVLDISKKVNKEFLGVDKWNEEIKSVNEYIYNPISFLLNKKSLGEVVELKNFSNQNDKYNKMLFEKRLIEKYNKVYGEELNDNYYESNHNWELKYSSALTLNSLMTIMQNNPNLLVFTKVTNYAEKETLLWIYIGSSLFLALVSLFVILRKDFR